MVRTRKKKQQNKRLLSHLDESSTDFQGHHEVQAEGRANITDEGISLQDINLPIQVDNRQVVMYILEDNIVSEVRREV